MQKYMLASEDPLVVDEWARHAEQDELYKNK